jgi:hypothetical protein
MRDYTVVASPHSRIVPFFVQCPFWEHAKCR